MAEVDAPDGATTTYSYDGTFHRMTAVVDGDENVTIYALDATGDVVAMTDPLLKTTSYSWMTGLLVSTTDPMWRTTLTTYDPRRRPTAVVQTEGNATYTAYDASGNFTRPTNESRTWRSNSPVPPPKSMNRTRCEPRGTSGRPRQEETEGATPRPARPPYHRRQNRERGTRGRRRSQQLGQERMSTVAHAARVAAGSGHALLVAYHIYRGPHDRYGKIPGVLGRSEFSLEIMLVIAHLVYVVGLSFDKVGLVFHFFRNLKLTKSQTDALLHRLARHWRNEFEILCTLHAKSLIVHTDETRGRLRLETVFVSQK